MGRADTSACCPKPWSAGITPPRRMGGCSWKWAHSEVTSILSQETTCWTLSKLFKLSAPTVHMNKEDESCACLAEVRSACVARGLAWSAHGMLVVLTTSSSIHRAFPAWCAFSHTGKFLRMQTLPGQPFLMPAIPY